jgi:hypothetical protein
MIYYNSDSVVTMSSSSRYDTIGHYEGLGGSRVQPSQMFRFANPRLAIVCSVFFTLGNDGIAGATGRLNGSRNETSLRLQRHAELADLVG